MAAGLLLLIFLLLLRPIPPTSVYSPYSTCFYLNLSPTPPSALEVHGI
jgi:hypothetical protein